MDALEEAIAVIRGWWHGQRSLRIDGAHYQVSGAHPGPTPRSAIPLWIGADKPRMLRLTGRLGDGWLPTVPYSRSRRGADRSNEAIDEPARRAGRDPAEIGGRSTPRLKATERLNGTEPARRAWRT